MQYIYQKIQKEPNKPNIRNKHDLVFNSTLIPIKSRLHPSTLDGKTRRNKKSPP